MNKTDPLRSMANWLKKHPHWASLFGLALILGALAIIALPSLNAPFILDDIDQLHQTATQDSITDALQRDCYGLYRPVKTAAFFFLSKNYPDSPVHWHLAGLFICCISTALFFFLTRRLFANIWTPLAATAIWATAPTQVSSYAWSSCINIQIMTMTVLSALILFDFLQSKPHGRTRSILFIVGISFMYTIAFFSYESAIVLPALLMIWSLCRGQSIWTRKSIFTMLGCGITGLVLLYVRHQMNGNLKIENSSIHGLSSLQLSWASGRIMWDHLSLWFWPFGRQAITGTLVNDGNSMLTSYFTTPWALLSALALAGWLTRKHYPMIALGLLFFFIAFLPTSNLVPLFNGPYADYYLIIPSMGLTLFLMSFLKLLTDKLDRATKPAIRIMVLTCCVILPGTRLLASANAIHWSRAWTNEQTLYIRTLEAMPDAYTAKASLAQCLLKTGDIKTAEMLAQAAVQAAPWFKQGRYILISIYLETNRMEDALTETEAVLETNPGQIYPWNVMGYLAENHLNDRRRAIAIYRKNQQLVWQAGSEHAVINLSRLLSLDGRDTEALEVLEVAILAAPGAKIIKMIHADLMKNPDLYRDAISKDP